MKTLVILFGWSIAAFALLQLVKIDIPNPPTATPADEVKAPALVMSALKKGCYDCHSNHTNWPWYSDIAPVSFEVRGHVRDGRKWLNFAIWNKYDNKKKQEFYKGMRKTLVSGAMPIPSYLWAHKEARLTPDERKTIIDWAKANIKE